MRSKPKSILQTTLELLSSNDSVFHSNNNNLTNLNQTCPNINLLSCSTTNNPPSSSRQDIITTDDDNFDTYQSMINKLNKDIKLINKKISNVEISGLSSSRITSEPDFLHSSRMIKESESNCIIPSESDRKVQENKLIDKLKQEYETSIAAKNAKMIELENNNKMLLDKQHQLEQQIQQLEENTKATTIQTNFETESEQQSIQRPHSVTKVTYNNNNGKGKTNVALTKKTIHTKEKGNSNYKRKSSKKKVSSVVPSANKRKNQISKKINNKKEVSSKHNVMNNNNDDGNYKMYLNQLKEIINQNEYDNKKDLLCIINSIEQATNIKIKELQKQHKEEMTERLGIIMQLEEENCVLKNKVIRIKEIAE
jgi:hypothetical protein